MASKTRIVKVFRDLSLQGETPFVWMPEKGMKRIKEILYAYEVDLSLATSDGTVFSDFRVALGYQMGNKQKVKVDIPLDGSPIHGMIKPFHEFEFRGIVYFIVEQEK